MTVSRRDFLKSAGVPSLATAVTTATVAEAQTGPRSSGPGEVPVTLMGNGKRIELKIEPRVTLLDAISDPDPAAAKRAYEAMMEMRKIDVAAIEAARTGSSA